MKTFIAIAGVLVVLVGWIISSYYGAYNYGADTETAIPAEYNNMENILAQYSLKVSEAVQVPGMKTDDLKAVMKDAMTGRYGADGSKATFQWIQENYPGQVSDALYSKIQVIIEAGRNKFENAQTKFIDTKRVYVATLKKNLFLSRGWWLKQGGYPMINIGFPNGTADDYQIISSKHAQESFETGVDKGLKLR